jgi:hypothetical protein
MPKPKKRPKNKLHAKRLAKKKKMLKRKHKKNKGN